MENKQITLTSVPESITKVEAFIDQLKVDLGIHEEVYGNMLVAITEAVNNAIFHGNKCDQNKQVELKAEKYNNSVAFVIRDEGKGFDYTNLPDPTAPENIEKPSGRGVFLIKHLSDMVIFSNNGNTVEIQFHV